MVWNCLASLNFKETNFLQLARRKVEKENFAVL